MATFLVTFVMFGLLMGAMALGLARGRRLQGSCGGVGGDDCSCSPVKRQRCQREQAAQGIGVDDGNRHLEVLPDSDDLR